MLMGRYIPGNMRSSQNDMVHMPYNYHFHNAKYSIKQSTTTEFFFRFQQCEKIAVIYCKLTYEKKRRPSKNYGTAPIGFSSIGSNWFQPERLVNVTNDGSKEGQARGRTRTTSISQSLALEKGMLSRIHCVGVVPVP